MKALHVYRLAYDELLPIGIISKDGTAFSYDPSYLAHPGSIPLSCSLPLQNDPFEAAAGTTISIILSVYPVVEPILIPFSLSSSTASVTPGFGSA